MTSSNRTPWRFADPAIRMAPSILSADFGRLGEEIARIESAGTEILHLDVMDGHFVPNISFGIPVVEKLRPRSKLYFDTHLMITDPLKYAEPFVEAGSDLLTFHIEVAEDPVKCVEHIRALGADVGVTLNPGTPVDALDPVIDRVDMVLVMSVWPGFGGQEFITDSLDRVRAIKSRLRPDQRLEIDGGIGPETIADAASAGADTFVAGSAIFGRDDPVAALDDLGKRARAALT